VTRLDPITLSQAADQARARAQLLRQQSITLLSSCETTLTGARRDGNGARDGSADAPRPDAPVAVVDDVEALRAHIRHLERLIETRSTIEQAKGIVMAAMSCDPDTAFAVLVRQSQHENRKLALIAKDLVQRTWQHEPS
jgi:hypothetical protein